MGRICFSLSVLLCWFFFFLIQRRYSAAHLCITIWKPGRQAGRLETRCREGRRTLPQMRAGREETVFSAALFRRLFTSPPEWQKAQRSAVQRLPPETLHYCTLPPNWVCLCLLPLPCPNVPTQSLAPLLWLECQSTSSLQSLYCHSPC